MRIVVAGGREEADFLIGSLLTKKHKVKVINDDANYSKYLAEKYNITVLKGDSTKEYILEDSIKLNATIFGLMLFHFINACIAQLVEHSLGKAEVTGSIPVVSSNIL